MTPLQKLTAFIFQPSGCVRFRRRILFAILSIHPLTIALLVWQDQLEISRKPAQQGPSLSQRPALSGWRPALHVQRPKKNSSTCTVPKPSSTRPAGDRLYGEPCQNPALCQIPALSKPQLCQTPALQKTPALSKTQLPAPPRSSWVPVQSPAVMFSWYPQLLPTTVTHSYAPQLWRTAAGITWSAWFVKGGLAPGMVAGLPPGFAKESPRAGDQNNIPSPLRKPQSGWGGSGDRRWNTQNHFRR